MSILLVGAAGSPADAVVTRLVSAGDQVRVVDEEPGRGAGWRALGAHVARGDPSDYDLIERAAQNVRTIVVLAGKKDDLGPVLDGVIEGARRATVDRIVLCAARPAREVVDRLARSGLEYVVLAYGEKRALLPSSLSKSVSPEDLARAVDAADDLGGSPALDLDLTRRAQWRPLALDPPEGI